MCAVPPLMVIEFLHRVVETLQAYFDDCSDNIIKDNYVIVFEVSSADVCAHHTHDAVAR
jgi:AP-3 complex subunit mu